MQRRLLYSLFTVQCLALLWIMLLNSDTFINYRFNSAVESAVESAKQPIALEFVNDSLTKWNSNKPLLNLKELGSEKEFVLTDNGLAYILSKTQNGDKLNVKYLSLAAFFNIKNDFLNNADCLENFHLSLNKTNRNDLEITIGEKVLYAQYDGQLPYWIYLLSLNILVLLLFANWSKKIGLYLHVGVAILCMASFLIPVNGFILGSSSIYAQSEFIPNLYQLILQLNIYFLLLAGIKKLKLTGISLALLLSLHGLVMSLFLKSIIHNSKITLDLFNQSTNLLLTACLLGIIGSFVLTFLIFIRRLNTSEKLSIAQLITLILAVQAVGYFLNFHDILVVGWGSLFFVILALLNKLKIRYKQRQLGLFIWLLFSICFVYLHYDLKRSANNETYLAQQIAEETDPFLSFNVARLEKNQHSFAIEIPNTDTLTFIENELFGNQYSEYIIKSKRDGLNPLYTLTFLGKTYYIYPKTYNYFKGFPQLLQNDKWYNHVSGRIYFARYYQNSLLQTNSPDFFPISLTHNHFIQQKTRTIRKVQNQEKTYTALVYVKHSPLEYSISIIVLIACFLCVLFITWQYDILQHNLNLKQKIQLSIFGIAILTLSLCSGIAFYQLKKANNASNLSALKEKAQSVQIELEHKFSRDSGKNLLQNKELLNDMLLKFSDVFFTDITLYNGKGNLLATSQKELYNNTLLGPQINQAYLKDELHIGEVKIISESIGKLSYSSAYIPLEFYGENYVVNLPFFARESVFNQQLQEFILQIINALILAALISIILAALLSRQIINPLSKLESLLEKIELNADLQKIQYTKNDEIGALVKAYNNKVDELKQMVAELATAERQMAWKQMAKQVAHEIKNPLTPMKLNAQMLMRLQEKTGEVSQEKIQTFAHSVVEQIDILTRIANDFSRFAEIPKMQIAPYNAIALLKPIEELYQHDETISFNINQTCDTDVLIDKDHVQRAITNLIKNAQEAVWETNKPKITLTAFLKNNTTLRIEVLDNGTGIDDALAEKIFEPNFTTKNSGMGLGLSMVKTSIEQMNGSIFFEENKAERGACFVLELPHV